MSCVAWNTCVHSKTERRGCERDGVCVYYCCQCVFVPTMLYFIALNACVPYKDSKNDPFCGITLSQERSGFV